MHRLPGGDAGVSVEQLVSLAVFVTVTRSVVTLGLGVYAALYRTSPGFIHWVGAGACGVLALLAAVLRPSHPVLSIATMNFFGILGFLLFLDGSRRFLGLGPLGRRWYGLGPVAVGVMVAAYGVPDTLLFRLWFMTLLLVGVLGTSASLWLRRVPPGSRGLHRAAALLQFAYAGLYLVRVAGWTILRPGPDLLHGGAWEATVVLLVGVLDVLWPILFLVANSERLEGELQASNRELEATLLELQVARDRDSLLSRILPVCPSCRQIEDGQGGWTSVEEYVGQRIPGDFSHGLCPSCAKSLYPDLADELG